MMNLLVIVAACLACGAFAANNVAPVHPRDNFYPFGSSQGDAQLHDADDSSSHEIHIPTRIVFFDGTYDSLWVNHNGIITTSGPFYTYTSAPFPLSTGNPGIAPYWTDVDISNGNNVPEHAIYYRQDTREHILRRATAEVMASFAEEVPNFQATWTFIATWYRVTYYGNNGHHTPIKTVTFQCVLVSDGIHSFALFQYGTMDWTSGTASQGNAATGLGGVGAQVGFDAGDGVNLYNLPGSQTDAIRHAVQNSSHRYRIDRAQIETPADPVNTDCTVGTYAPQGAEPCERCPIGYFQDHDGARFCHICPHGMTTRRRASAAADDCYTPGSSQFDPHFMITDPITKEHLCFDYTGSNSEVVELVTDESSDIAINGKLFAVSEETPDVTFFADIEVKTDDSVVVFNRSEIIINGDSFSWSRSDAVVSGDVVVHPVEDKLETFMVEIDGGRVSVVVNRHDGPIAGKYLGIYVVRVDGLSELSKGMIGQFVHSSFAITEENDKSIATVSLARSEVTVPVTKQSRFSPTAQGKIDCWLYKPEGVNQLYSKLTEDMVAGGI